LDEAIFATSMQLAGGGSPAGPRTARRGNHDLTGLGAKLDIAGQSRLLEERFGNADALGIADGNDTGLDG
jgi:hypothetical protein